MYNFLVAGGTVGGIMKRFLGGSDRGVTAIEYALIALLIAVPIVGAVFAVGGQLTTIFTHVKNGFPSAS